MKTLFILRHAKAAWGGDAGLSDFERPLDERGLKEAAFVGSYLAENSVEPDLILSSPARRARATTDLVTKNAGFGDKVAVRLEEKIYEASPFRLLEILDALGDKEKTVLLVGHNPGLEGLIKILTGELRAMPTAGLAKINLQIENWSDIAADCGALESLIRPPAEPVNF